jgi:hypothetical protein
MSICFSNHHFGGSCNPIHNINLFELQESGKIMEGVCTRIDGCRVVSGTCPTCVIEKVWE